MGGVASHSAPRRRIRAGRALTALIAAAMLLGVGACSALRSAGSTETSSAASSSSGQPQPPAASGPGCATDAGTPSELAKMGDLLVSEALAKLPGTKQFAAYLDDNSTLGNALDKAQKLAIFVPDDAAFAKLTPEQLATLGNAATRDSMLAYAVTAQPVDPAKLKGAQQVPTIEASTAMLTLTQTPSGVQLNGVSTVVCGAITTSRALIFITDTVLFPPA